MLQRVQTEVSQPGGIGMAVDTKDATLIAKLVQQKFAQLIVLIFQAVIGRAAVGLRAYFAFINVSTMSRLLIADLFGLIESLSDWVIFIRSNDSMTR